MSQPTSGSTISTKQEQTTESIVEKLAQIQANYKPALPKTPVSISKTPIRHLPSSPTSETPKRSAALATPYSDDENSDDEISKSSRGFNQLDGNWPRFPSFIDKDIDGRYLEVLIYMLVGPENFSVHKVDTVKLALSTFWENERKLNNLAKSGKFTESKSKDRLAKRTDLINSLVRDGFNFDEKSIKLLRS
jgi:hypothetical protein